MIESPKPAPTRPNFGNQGQTAGEAIRQATQGVAQNRGTGGDYGAGIPVAHEGMNTGVDILSDTMGVDFNPYLKRLLREIYNTWIPLIPEEGTAAAEQTRRHADPLHYPFQTGTLERCTSRARRHDDALNRAAWGSITGVGQFQPLPKEFHGPNLELRIHYLVNKTSE